MALSQEERSKVIKAAVFVVIVVAVCLMTPGMGISDTRTAIRTHDETIAEEAAKLKDMQTVAAKKEALERELASLRPEIEEQERRLPRTGNLDDLFRELHYIGERNGVSFDSTEELPTEKNAERGYERLPSRVRLAVDFHGLGRFINAVETSERFLRIDGLTIGGVDSNRIAPDHDWSKQQIELELATFRFVDVEKPAAAEKPAGAKK